ncbi:uncharacterized protein RBU57_014641 isoform 1-T1 [Macrochelys suwanniensis]
MQLSFTGVILFLAGYSSGLAVWGLTGPREVSRPLGESVSVQCQYHESYQRYEKYWCRGAVRRSCQIAVQTTGSEAKAKGDRVSIRDNHTLHTFTVTMENLSLEDAGIYWCGISKSGYDPGVPVKVTVLPGCFSALTAPREVRGPPRGTVSIPCQYCERAQGYQKYWCRGAEWNSCSKVVETKKSEVEVKWGRVSITDNHTTSTFTVTMENLTLGDAGIYWCGINIRGGGDPYSLVNVTVLPALSTTVMVTTGSLSAAISTANTAEHPKRSPFTSTMFLLPVLLLVLLILLIGAILLARRMMLKRKKGKRVKMGAVLVSSGSALLSFLFLPHFSPTPAHHHLLPWPIKRHEARTLTLCQKSHANQEFCLSNQFSHFYVQCKGSGLTELQLFTQQPNCAKHDRDTYQEGRTFNLSRQHPGPAKGMGV